MTIGLLVTARMGSTRLADKHLRDVGGRPALAHLLARVEREFARELEQGKAIALIATGGEARNRALAPLTKGTSFGMFYGDDDNVPLRHLQAAERFGLDAIVSIDGDDIFCAPEAMREVARRLTLGAAVAKTRGLPLGMNAWGYSRAGLAKALGGARPALLETGWGRIFEGQPSDDCELDVCRRTRRSVRRSTTPRTLRSSTAACARSPTGASCRPRNSSPPSSNAACIA